ncbi:MAG: class I SAM-dependent methyltransferase [Casimicrobium sp.]
MTNIDHDTVASFGDEWQRFDQSGMTEDESRKVFGEYFALFPWDALPKDAEGFDMGCGTGRWARWVAPRVGKLHCVDPSAAIEVARVNLTELSNVVFHHAGVDDVELKNGSQDFGYSLGVLHHVPDTAAAVRSCVDLLKPGAPLLLYLYYALDNRPWWFRLVWRLSDLMRQAICRMPPWLKHVTTDAIGVIIYWPLARLSLIADRVRMNASFMPLYYYRNHSFYTMRTDARDRFGTPLEQRFSKQQVAEMMTRAGLVDISFGEHAPFWCALGTKKLEGR